MTKKEIVRQISEQLGLTQLKTKEIVQLTFDAIVDTLISDPSHRIELRNFGVFQPRLTKPRIGRNPNQPGSSFVIPSRATVKFKPGKIMRQRVEKLSRELKEAEERQAKTAAAGQGGG